jgi:hypothetical protein
MTTAGPLGAGRNAEEAQSHRAPTPQGEGVALSIGAGTLRVWVNRIPHRGGFSLAPVLRPEELQLDAETGESVAADERVAA